MARRKGEGTVERHGNAYRARMWVNGERVTIANGSEELCAQALAAAALRLDAQPLAGHTLSSWGALYLDQRDMGGEHRNVKSDRSIWKSRVAVEPIAQLPLDTITPRDVREWVASLSDLRRKPKPLARQSVRNTLNLLRTCLQAAVDADHLVSNPARDVKGPKRVAVAEAWDGVYLTPKEIERLTGEAVPERHRLVFAFAIATGLRQGEIWGLRWSDVDLETARVTVRRSYVSPPKNGKPRTVPLFAGALEALKAQRARDLPGDLVFPGTKGKMRSKGYDASLSVNLGRAKIRRKVTFHHLRHTCASHLRMGTWGRTWSLDEIGALLGHASRDVTERYAHLGPSVLHRAAAGTDGHRIAPNSPMAVRKTEPPIGLEPTTYGLRNRQNSVENAEEIDRLGPLRGRAIDLLQAAAAGKPLDRVAVVQLAAAVVEALAAVLPHDASDAG